MSYFSLNMLQIMLIPQCKNWNDLFHVQNNNYTNKIDMIFKTTVVKFAIYKGSSICSAVSPWW